MNATEGMSDEDREILWPKQRKGNLEKEDELIVRSDGELRERAAADLTKMVFNQPLPIARSQRSCCRQHR